MVSRNVVCIEYRSGSRILLIEAVANRQCPSRWSLAVTMHPAAGNAPADRACVRGAYRALACAAPQIPTSRRRLCCPSLVLELNIGGVPTGRRIPWGQWRDARRNLVARLRDDGQTGVVLAGATVRCRCGVTTPVVASQYKASAPDPHTTPMSACESFQPAQRWILERFDGIQFITGSGVRPRRRRKRPATSPFSDDDTFRDDILSTVNASPGRSSASVFNQMLTRRPVDHYTPTSSSMDRRLNRPTSASILIAFEVFVPSDLTASDALLRVMVEWATTVDQPAGVAKGNPIPGHGCWRFR